MFDRYEATKYIVEQVGDASIIASLGGPDHALFTAGDRPKNLYFHGSMGLAASVGLGLALAITDRKIVVLDGDGSLLMNMGTLCTIADQQPRNLVHIVLDNEQWGETGGQPSHTSGVTSLAGVARGAGIAKVEEVTKIEEFRQVVSQALKEDGPWCIVAKVEDGDQVMGNSPMDTDVNLVRFMQNQ
ncbi:thiamine pyrophosphate-dependent enzyme [Chloroflexota bacterium]